MESKFLVLFAALFVIGMLGAAFFLSYTPPVTGMVTYANRPQVSFEKTVYSESEYKTMYRVYYDSKDARISGLLSVPKNDTPMPAFLIIPAVSIDKFTEQNHLSNALNDMGFITLTIDTRGFGESTGTVKSIQQDLEDYADGKEPTSHKVIYDALLAYDVLEALPEVDPSRIFAAGESRGGRIAAVAAGIENEIAGAMLVSTSGYNFDTGGNPVIQAFADSINPYTYIGKISPSPVVVVHSKQDTVVLYADAADLYEKAGNPKRMFTLETGGHTFESFDDKSFLEEAVGFLLGD
jgi:dipeptidyl aminopeptidase/acylaminoacyl peptidase